MGTLGDAEVVGDSCFRFAPYWCAGSDRSLNAPVLRALKPALPRSAAQLNLASKWLGLSRNSGRDFLTCAALLHNANLSRFKRVSPSVSASAEIAEITR